MMQSKRSTQWLFAFITIIFLATLLRFWNVHDRLILFSDSARDALVGLAAVRTGEIPLTGSFSSAGPFVFGPMFYYVIMGAQAMLPGVPFAPWYLVGLLSFLFPVVVAISVSRVSGRWAGLIALMLTSISPAQVMRATALTQHSVVGIASACFLLFMMLYREKRTFWWAFFLGLSSGVAASLHYQALILLIAGFAAVGLWRSRPLAIIRDVIWYVVGAVIPFLPLLMWDSGQQWANVRNLLDYLLIGQYRIFVSRRWLTFLTDFLPTTWGQIIGGNQLVGLILMMLVGIMGAFSIVIPHLMRNLYRYRSLVKPGMTKMKHVKDTRATSLIFWPAFVLGLLVIAARYYRGELFEGYLVALHPFILFLSAWVIWEMWKKKKVIGLIMLSVIVAGSVHALVPIVTWNENLVSPAEQVVREIQQAGIVPVTPFDFHYYSSEFTYSLSYLLETRGLVSPEGTPIGVCLWQCPEYLTKQSIAEVPYMDRAYHVIVIDRDATDLGDPKLWTDVSAAGTLREVGFWWRRTPLVSSFSLSAFIRNDVLK